MFSCPNDPQLLIDSQERSKTNFIYMTIASCVVIFISYNLIIGNLCKGHCAFNFTISLGDVNTSGGIGVKSGRA